MIAFRECPSCAAKPGSPTLCVACLHNRTMIDSLLVALHMALNGWESSDCGWRPGDRQRIHTLRKEFDS